MGIASTALSGGFTKEANAVSQSPGLYEKVKNIAKSVISGGGGNASKQVDPVVAKRVSPGELRRQLEQKQRINANKTTTPGGVTYNDAKNGSKLTDARVGEEGAAKFKGMDLSSNGYGKDKLTRASNESDPEWA